MPDKVLGSPSWTLVNYTWFLRVCLYLPRTKFTQHGPSPTDSVSTHDGGITQRQKRNMAVRLLYTQQKTVWAVVRREVLSSTEKHAEQKLMK